MVNNKPNNNNTALAKSKETVANLTATKYDKTRLDHIFKNINNYKAFAFDFDMTLTMDHTRGYPVVHLKREGKSLTTLFGEGGLAKLFQMIQDIKAKGIDVYIVSRGEYGQLVKTFRDDFQYNGQSLLNLIGGETHIYGAITTNSEYPASETRGKYPLAVANDNVWAGYKLDYLKDINRKYNSTQHPNILFFDDTPENIDIIYAPNDNSSWVNGIQQDKGKALNATLAIVSELLKHRDRKTPTASRSKLAGTRANKPEVPIIKPVHLSPTRSAPLLPPARTTASNIPKLKIPPPPPTHPNTVEVVTEPIFGTAPTRRKSKGASIVPTNPAGNTRPATNANIPVKPTEVIFEEQPGTQRNNSNTNKQGANNALPQLPKTKRFAGLRKLMPTKNPFKPTNATKKRLKPIGKFFTSPKRAFNAYMQRKDYEKQTGNPQWNITHGTNGNYDPRTNVKVKNVPKKKGFFRRLLSGTRKRLPSMGKVKGFFGRKPSTRKVSANTNSGPMPVEPQTFNNPVAILFGKYKVNAYSFPYPSESNSPVTFLQFTTMEGKPIKNIQMVLPENAPNDTQELWSSFKMDFMEPNDIYDNKNLYVVTNYDQILKDILEINTAVPVEEHKAEGPNVEVLYAKVKPREERPIATLFDKYNLYAKTSESGHVEYIFKDMDGKVVELDNLTLPDYIAEDMRELAQNKLAKFKESFVSASYCPNDNIDCHTDLVTDLNKNPAIKRPEPVVEPPPLPERIYPRPESVVPGQRVSGNNKPARRASIIAEEPPVPAKPTSNTQPSDLKRSGSSGQRTKSNRPNNKPPTPVNIPAPRQPSGNKTRTPSGNKPITPPRTTRMIFNNAKTDFNSIVPRFLEAFKANLSASENELINANAEAIAKCINKPDGCNKNVMKMVTAAKDSIRTILESTLTGLNVGASKKANLLRRVTQLFGN